MRHVIAIDQGTTGSTVLVLDEQLPVRGRGYKEFRQIYPQPGWVEHDPEDIWASVTRRARRRACTGIEPAVDRGDRHHEPARDHRACGIARPARPSHNAIVWQDRRTADSCAELKAAGQGSARARAHRPDARPVLLGHEDQLDAATTSPGMAARARTGELAFGTIDTYLLWRLTGGAVHATDVTNASRTLLFDLQHARRGATSCSSCSACRARCCRRCVPSSGAIGDDDAACPGCPTASRSRASPAISRRRCSARPASRPATRSARTAPARSS